jgi:hypothetical protein
MLLVITAYEDEEWKMRKKSHDMCEFCEGIVEERIIQAGFHFKGQAILGFKVKAKSAYAMASA